MSTLLLGILLFFGMHSSAIIAPQLRERFVAQSELGWKAIYAITSLAGIILITQGYTELKHSPTLLYTTANGFRHLSAILMLPVFIFFLAPYFPGKIKTVLKHPQLVAVKLWAISHLLVNGTLADVLLFGAFLLWAVANRISLKRRLPQPVIKLKNSKVNDILVTVIGLSFYVLFLLYLHKWLIGISPLLTS